MRLKKMKKRKRNWLKKATGDPKDPRLDANTPKSMEELEEMTKWMEIPNLWKDLLPRSDRFTCFKRNLVIFFLESFDMFL